MIRGNSFFFAFFLSSFTAAVSFELPSFFSIASWPSMMNFSVSSDWPCARAFLRASFRNFLASWDVRLAGIMIVVSRSLSVFAFFIYNVDI